MRLHRVERHVQLVRDVALGQLGGEVAEHGQLAFNLGQPVEGYTNFLWTVVLGVLMIPGIPPEISSRVLGTGCALATLYVVFRVTERALERKTPWACVPAILLACSSGFACWTSGGLETQLFTLLDQ